MPARKQYAANGASVLFSAAKYAVRNFTERYAKRAAAKAPAKET